MTVLVTGASGLIGRQLLDRLGSGDAEVVALTHSEPPVEERDVRWVRQDLTRPLDEDALPESVDAIVHLAQSERYRDFPDGARDLFEVNVHSTHRLLEYARRGGARSFVLASTGGVYAPDGDPITEDAQLLTPGPYFRSKRIAELLVEDYQPFLSTAVLRFFFVYGPKRAPTLVSRLAAQIVAGEEIEIDGDPGLRINPIFAADAAAAVEAAIPLDEHAVVNIAGDEVVSVGDLARRLAAALGREASIRHQAASGPQEFVGDTTQMRSLLRVTPQTPLDQGLQAVARSFAVGERS